ncbi:hypothetical protein [Pseudonocardia humida]|uniref:Uncharacterized protein n=1 Tax=Pseudonocardia humida TaxID=2800819 RepID=A0ABT1AAS6_9PSEU|nr:hypothetical protein [Pseudonocardia humida]MCO1660151.1 hypothetical protein [Pseudonocardia humida]
MILVSGATGTGVGWARAGHNAVLTDDVAEVLGRAPNPVRTWTRDHRAAFVPPRHRDCLTTRPRPGDGGRRPVTAGFDRSSADRRRAAFGASPRAGAALQ